MSQSSDIPTNTPSYLRPAPTANDRATTSLGADTAPQQQEHTSSNEIQPPHPPHSTPSSHNTVPEASATPQRPVNGAPRAKARFISPTISPRKEANAEPADRKKPRWKWSTHHKPTTDPHPADEHSKLTLAFLAVFCPPAAVWGAMGHRESRAVWLCLALTLLGWIPGVIGAVFIILALWQCSHEVEKREQRRRAHEGWEEEHRARWREAGGSGEDDHEMVEESGEVEGGGDRTQAMSGARDPGERVSRHHRRRRGDDESDDDGDERSLLLGPVNVGLGSAM